MRFSLALALFLFLPQLNMSQAQAQSSFSKKAKGTTGASFLKLAVGARAIAMGEAYSALANDSLSLYWNPAGLGNMNQSQSINLMHALYVESLSFGFLSYATKLPGDLGGVGLAAHYLTAGSIDQTDEAGVSVGSYSPQDLALSLGFGFNFLSASFGATFKYLSSKIVNQATGFAADVGLSSSKEFSEVVALALTARNIGSGIKFQSETEDLPLELRLGSLFRLTDNFLISLEAIAPKDNVPIGAFGLESRQPIGDGAFSLRAGFNSRTLGDISGLSGVSAGFGVSFRGMSLDYALAPLGKLGLTHRVSLGFNFGGSE